MIYQYMARVEPSEGGFLVSFPDVPEAITEGDSREDALANAADALSVALRGYLAEGRDVPAPASQGKGLSPVPVDVATAYKLAVLAAYRAAGITKAELARRLGKANTEAHRILDPDHATQVPALEAALAALGRQAIVSVREPA